MTVTFKSNFHIDQHEYQLNCTQELELPETRPVGHLGSIQISGPPTSSTSPPPNHAQRGLKGNYWLTWYQVALDPKDNIWRYTRSNKPVPKSEFWIPQRLSRPLDGTFLHNNQYYWEGTEAYFDEGLSHWVAKDSAPNSTHPFPDQFFQTAHWIPGTEKDLPQHLRSILTQKLLQQVLEHSEHQKNLILSKNQVIALNIKSLATLNI